MKKNVVGHMLAAKEPVKEKLHRWKLFPKLACLLLALLLWLLIENSQNAELEPALPYDNGSAQTEQMP